MPEQEVKPTCYLCNNERTMYIVLGWKTLDTHCPECRPKKFAYGMLCANLDVQYYERLIRAGGKPGLG